MEALVRGDGTPFIRGFRNNNKRHHLRKLAGYIERNRDGIWYDEARALGICQH